MGLVATLTSVPPEHSNKATALEIAAGGKLYNVVVQDERVGKDLLQNGKLKKRVTIIPLNKINAFTLTAQVRPHSIRRFLSMDCLITQTETSTSRTPRSWESKCCTFPYRLPR